MLDQTKDTPWIQTVTTPRAWTQTKSLYFAAKRIMDFLIAFASLIFLLPLLAIVYIAIKIDDSKGSPIYTQERVTSKRVKQTDGTYIWKEVPFTIYKFRTMRSNCSSRIHQQFMKAYIEGDETTMAALQQEKANEESKFKLNGDPRITRVGKFLRKTSLDELPQLWNVMRGDMSMVGPRPPIPYEVEMYRPRHHQRFHTVPGITGYWQVKGRSSIGFEEMVDLDLEYIEKQSLWLDWKILLMTLPAVLLDREAS